MAAARPWRCASAKTCARQRVRPDARARGRASARFEEALDATDRALAVRPDAVTALLLRAKAQRGLGQAAQAQATLRRVLELDPDHAEAKKLLEQ